MPGQVEGLVRLETSSSWPIDRLSHPEGVLMSSRQAGAPGAYRAQSLTRGLHVLRALAAAREPLTLQQINQRTDIPKPTLVRLLSILTSEGCTVRLDERPTYGLGPTVMEIAAGVGADMDPETLARPRLELLSKAAGHTATLGVLSDGEVLHVCAVLADRPVRYTTHSGTRDATYCTGLGKALLAFSGTQEASRALQGRKLTARTSKTITTKGRLETELKETRQRGWSHDDEEGAEGLRSFAVPITISGQTVGALGLSGPSAELDRTQSDIVVALLLEAAADLANNAQLIRGLRSLAGHDVSNPTS